MLSWFKDLVNPVRRVDTAFGNMRYLRDGEVWEGWAEFRPIQSQVEVLFSGSLAGPTDEQRAFFGQLERDYPALWPRVEGELRKALATDADAPQDARFLLKGIDLPKVLGALPDWELLYETEPPSCFFAVQMKGWQPINVSVEC
jgi:hypothetical protein